MQLFRVEQDKGKTFINPNYIVSIGEYDFSKESDFVQRYSDFSNAKSYIKMLNGETFLCNETIGELTRSLTLLPRG